MLDPSELTFPFEFLKFELNTYFIHESLAVFKNYVHG